MNPFVGPRPFFQTEAHLFFGRDLEARKLAALASFEPVVLFYGRSGVGKSSLINTSLIPALQKEGFYILPIGRVGVPLPAEADDVENIFIFSLLLSLASDVGPKHLVGMTLSGFLQDSKLYGEFNLSDGTKGAQLRMLLIDQFEEIFTTHPGRWRDREDFFLQLNRALEDDPGLSVILTLREDFLGMLEPYTTLLLNKLGARFQLLPLTRMSALQAVTRPAEIADSPFAPGVAETLVDELIRIRVLDVSGVMIETHGQYVEPMQLQIVCRNLWSHLPVREGSAASVSYEVIATNADVGQTLTTLYEQTVMEAVAVTSIPEKTLRQWFETILITPAQTRGKAYVGREQTAGIPSEAIEILADAHLIRTETVLGIRWVELVHNRFVEPILESNKLWLESHRVWPLAPESSRSRIWLFLGFILGLLLGILGTLTVITFF